jgi:hypothetical protein
VADYSGRDKRERADEIIAEMRKQGRTLLGDLLPGPENAGRRQELANKGVFKAPRTGKELRVATMPIPGTDEREVIAVAAVTRDYGTTDDLISEINDFVTSSSQNRQAQIDLYWRVVRSEGLVAQAVGKLAALLSSGGRFKVRKARKGKKQKATEELQAMLDEFARNVNNAPEDGVVKGARGLQALTQQAVRQALVEGSWIGRMVWTEHPVTTLGKSASLPMTIQSLSVKYVEPVDELVKHGIEAFFWVPENDLLQQYNAPKYKELKPILKKYLPRDVVKQLQNNNGRVWLDPALLLHVRHRAVDTEPFGESIIKPALFAIAFKRAVETLDLVSTKNLINRLTIVMVGNSEPGSPYADANVQKQRAALMQEFFADPGPNMTIVWQGDDVEVVDVGAGDTLNLDGRHKVAESKVKYAIGVPDALLAGTSDGSKASGFASLLAASAQLEELQTHFEQTWTTVGERIALENGYTDVDIIYEFDNSMMLDRMEEWNQRRLDYQGGVLSIRDYIASLGYDPDAVFTQKCLEQGLDPNTATWKEVFVPLAGLPGQGTPGPDGKAMPPGMGGNKPPGQGRTPDGQTGKPTPERAPEDKKPTEDS